MIYYRRSLIDLLPTDLCPWIQLKNAVLSKAALSLRMIRIFIRSFWLLSPFVSSI